MGPRWRSSSFFCGNIAVLLNNERDMGSGGNDRESIV